MLNTIPAATALPRPLALTVVFFEVIDEEGRMGSYGRSHLSFVQHPYQFVSREAAGGFAAAMCDRHGYDGYRLVTPGYAPPQPVFDNNEFPI